ncbi:SpvB/TcaC N-terminal domain-containing protein [Ornithinimicrobium avium]|uniref:Insecticide toxin TcdB middle/N-terminal domain-containing protein n=1 Tax=Ornithinimicrobium avium TaxID=2283195 RepID=A0A345NKW5_9MICO|nr:SpvB/TcaC N-terminal domain-containing protein [Ornithinimicrobium avium]AXH95673.1 hypothetical protein DV701_05650 [Ornithinimicrobium avium]
MATTSRSPRITRALGVAVAASMAVAGLTVPVLGTAGPVVAADDTLGREAVLTPEQLGTGGLDGLQYADPTEALSLIDPPTAGSRGGASLSYPLLVPPGRGITPDLSLTYGSEGDDGWTGMGWDLSVGEVAVDTTFGAPWFDADEESESYTLDGDELVPNAVRDDWEPRVAERQDWTRQVETGYEQIIRHGDSPTTYFWEVRDKQGNVRWYGGTPDSGGPVPEVAATIDPSAIVTDLDGNGVRWLLSAQRDVGVNLITYHYETLRYESSDSGWDAVDTCTHPSRICGSHTFLSRIDYTAKATADGPEDPAYQVRFELEDGDRLDPVVDATGGYVDVLAQRLATVKVLHGDPADQPRTSDDTYGDLAVRYDLAYLEDTPFDKSLLGSLTQSGGDPDETAVHTFGYFDDVRAGDGTYAGFGESATWLTGDDLRTRSMLDKKVAPGALGASESNSAEGHAYIGFNPEIPQKVGSFGGSIQVGGGETKALSEWMDINGDDLPDKVWLDGRTVSYRLNQNGPKGTTEFAGPQDTSGIDSLSFDQNVDVQLSVEAYLGVTVSFGLGTSVSWSNSYFSDVNSDGLPDLVNDGTVLFNHLDDQGRPTFESSSTNTVVPLPTGSGPAAPPSSDLLQQIQDQLEESSPLVDTVRRWTAPACGRVVIEAPVTLTPVDGDSLDGVRVAVQLGDDELAFDELTVDGTTTAFEAAGPVDPAEHDDDSGTAYTCPADEPVDLPSEADQATPGGVAFPLVLDVAAGDAIYFRVGSVDDGAGDQVTWSPVISYAEVAGFGSAADVPPDVNGLSQTVYDAAADFTTVGRPDTRVGMPYAGTVSFSATIEKSAETSDDLDLVLEHGGVPVDLGADAHLTADFTGTRTVTASFDVTAPPLPDPDHPEQQVGAPDTVGAHLAVDTPIDLGAVEWSSSLTYTAATGPDGTALDVADADGDPRMVMDLTPEVDIYPQRRPAGVSVPWTSSVGGTFDAVVGLTQDTGQVGGPVTVSVKDADGVVAQATLKLDPNPVPFALASVHTVQLDAALTSDTDYWVEVTMSDPSVSETTELTSFALRPDGASDGSGDVALDVPVLASGLQGIFPLPYRGWAVAGYRAGGDLATRPIQEDAFVVDPDDYPDDADTQRPDGFDDVADGAPTTERAYAYLGLADPPGVPAELAADFPRRGPLAGPVWQGTRENLAASATSMRSSRLGADSIDLGVAGGSGRAVTRVSVTAPAAALAIGLGPLGGSLGVSPSFGLVDLEDLNGDGYPDVVTDTQVQYTRQRGGFAPDSVGFDGETEAQNLTASASLGLSIGLVDINANAKGQTNATEGDSAGKGGDANESGVGLGVDLGVSGSWTNPTTSGGSGDTGVPGVPTNPAQEYGEDFTDAAGEATDGGSTTQRALADVNGDGLPDVVRGTPDGVFVRYNLGYAFTEGELRLGSGGFGTRDSYAGSTGGGFSTPWAEFAGGVTLDWNYDMARWSWQDLNGDGILDQVHKGAIDGPPTVRFGTGSGLRDAVTYGPMQSGQPAMGSIDVGQQASFDRSSSVGGGFNFTVYVGPLCLPTPLCYIVINPGASYQNSLSSSEVTLADVNGDGYADSLATTDDAALQVMLNTHGRTNLLHTVDNPLGGTVELDYERKGNTVEHPGSVWVMSSVRVDDGHPGVVDGVDTDGADVLQRTFDYDGLRFDRVHRQSLGFATVTEHEVDASDGTVIRSTERSYLNDNVFDAGLATTVVQYDASIGRGEGNIQGATMEWGFRDARDALGDIHAPVTTVDAAGLPGAIEVTGVGSLGTSVAPLLLEVGEQQYDGAQVGQETLSVYAYDGLGNVLTQLDEGETETTADDVLTRIVYSTCNISSTIGCPTAPAAPSPLWDQDVCPTWVSLPAEITLTNGASGASEIVYGHRDGRAALCDNASVTHLEEQIDGTGATAVTDLAYNEWGAYDRIVHPAGKDGVRYAVQYTYDADRHSDVARVAEYDLATDAAVAAFIATGDTSGALRTGVTSSATFDPLSGRVASRTNAPGWTTSYTYDTLGRIVAISQIGESEALVSFDYAPSDPDYGYAVAHHTDALHPGDTIDTVTFVDGLGRTTQTKRDVSLHTAVGEPGVAGRSVSGAVAYDALGRVVSDHYPTVDQQPELTAYDLSVPDPAAATVTVLDLWDAPDEVTQPGGRVTTNVYTYTELPGSDPATVVYETVSTDPRGRATTTWTDMRGRVLQIDDEPAGEPRLTSTYDYAGTGALLSFTDSSGEVTTHAYDMLGRRTSTDTPDAGLVEMTYDDEGRLTSRVTPNLRAAGTATTYDYQLGRLVTIDHPDGTPDVSYTYGAMGADGNGAGRITRVEDGTRILDLGYSRGGTVVKQAAQVKLHNWDPARAQDFTWTTTWDYDGLGRLLHMTYPDSERLTYDYDAGGLVRAVTGEEDGYEDVIIGFDEEGEPIVERRPRTWHYDYLLGSTYDEFLSPRSSEYGNAVTTEWAYDPATRWLDRQRTISADRKVKKPAQTEIQDLNYDYDAVGNVLAYRNELPAPEPSLFGGPSRQTYELDAYDRLVGAQGQWDVDTKATRAYALDLELDEHRNVVAKNQRDVIRKGKKELVQDETTYTFDRTYSDAAPGLAESADGTVGPRSYHFDADGNLLGTKDSKGRWIRQLTWDATDRLTLVDDSSASTTYKYDDSGQRMIERGPNGETAFVNPWFTLRNGTEIYKHVWAGDNRIATQRDDGGEEELTRYFLHQDLQGSTNMVTDYRGETFQHLEYFPGGEIWFMENSTVYRTPYLFGGHYYDERRDLLDVGPRWYDTREEMLYSPDPLLAGDPTAVVANPELRAAYSFAGSNPVSFIDPSGQAFIWTKTRQNAQMEEIKKYRAALDATPALRAQALADLQRTLPSSFAKYAISKHTARIQKLDQVLSAVPLVEVNVSTGTVKLGFVASPQVTVRKGSATGGDDASGAAPPRPDAVLPGGPGPDVGGDAAADSLTPAQVQKLKPLPPLPHKAAADAGGDATDAHAQAVQRQKAKPLPPTPVKQQEAVPRSDE